jgi:hypothetical protein
LRRKYPGEPPSLERWGIRASEGQVGCAREHLTCRSNRTESPALPADRFVPSTELCSPCHSQNRNLSLCDREWICPESDTKHRRDQRAAYNLRYEGIKQLVAGRILETQNACEQRVRPKTVGNAAVSWNPPPFGRGEVQLSSPAIGIDPRIVWRAICSWKA